jgi:hypothetical protein
VGERDLLALVDGRRAGACARARDLVRRPFLTVDPSVPLDDVVVRMALHGMDRVGVARGARTLGLVTLKSLLTALACEFVARLEQVGLDQGRTRACASTPRSRPLLH